MKRNHNYNNYTNLHSNTQVHSNINAEQLIEETRKTLNSFLTNLRAKENSMQLYGSVCHTQQNKRVSPTLKNKNYISTPVIPRPIETCPNQLNIIYKKRENISPLISPTKTKQNLSSANLNKRKTRNLYPSPTLHIQSQPRSQTKLYTSTSISSNNKSKANISQVNNMQPLQKVKDDIKKIKNANIENKKAIVNMVNIHKKYAQDILNKLKEYTSKNIIKDKNLMNMIREAKSAEKITMKELQKYKQSVGNLTYTKENLLKEKKSISQEKEAKVKEIQVLKKEIESMRSEKGENINEIKLLRDEKEEYKKRNVKLIEENALLQIQIQENKHIQQKSTQIQKYSFNSDYLIIDSRNTFQFKASPKQIHKLTIVNNNTINYNSITNPQKKISFEIAKQFQNTFQQKQISFKKLKISSNNNVVNYTKTIKKGKQILMISQNIKMSINPSSKKKMKEMKEKNDLLKQIKDITQINKDLLKDKTSLEKQICDQKEQLDIKEKEMVTQNMELLKLIEENDHMATEVDDKTNENLLKDKEIQSLKYDLSTMLTQFNSIKEENEKMKLQHNQNINNANNKETLDKIKNDLLQVTKVKEAMFNEMMQLQMQIKKDNEELKKNKDYIELLNTQKEEMKKKENELHNEIQTIKDELQNKTKEEKLNKMKLQEMIDKGYDEGESIESLREKVTMLRLQLNQNNESINKAREVLKKAKSFDECSKSMDIVLKDYIPKNEEQINAINLLKIIFGFKNIKLSSSTDKPNENDLSFEEAALQNEEPLSAGRGSSLKQKGYFKKLLQNLNNKDKP